MLLTRYRRFARSKVRNYFLVGADADDLEQEGLIGLYKAARDYRADREASFPVFAELCVTRQIITAVKAATRQKHQPLNAVRLDLDRSFGDRRRAATRPTSCSATTRSCDPADDVVDDDRLRIGPARRSRSCCRRSKSTCCGSTSTGPATPRSASR